MQSAPLMHLSARANVPGYGAAAIGFRFPFSNLSVKEKSIATQGRRNRSAGRERNTA